MDEFARVNGRKAQFAWMLPRSLGMVLPLSMGSLCSCGGLSGARCLDCMASLIESDVSRECHVGVLLMLAFLKHNFHITLST